MNLFILATLEAVEAGIEDPNEAFMEQTLLSEGQTIGEFFGPQMIKAISDGKLPKIFICGPERKNDA